MITQTDLPILEWILVEIGEGSSRAYRIAPSKYTRKTAYIINLESQKAYRVAKLLLPYLKLKKERAQLVVDFYEKYKDFPSYSEEKIALAHRGKRFNKYGESHALSK